MAGLRGLTRPAVPLTSGQGAPTGHVWLNATYQYLQHQGRPFTAVDLCEEMLSRFDKHADRLAANAKIAAANLGRQQKDWRPVRLRVLELAGQGGGVHAIAAECGVNRRTVQNYLRTSSLSVPRSVPSTELCERFTSA